MDINYQAGEKVNLNTSMALSVIKQIYPYNAETGRALYQVKDGVTGLNFALKCFNLPLNPENTIKAEMIALNKLNEPDVFPRALHFSKSGQNGYLLLDWMQGTTLEEAYPGGCQETFDHPIRLTALRQTCAAVARIHAQRLLHRDLKASNVVVKKSKDPDSGVCIIDFGLAALRRQTVEGTLGYQPPEQEGVRNFNLGAPADVYSLGQIGWWLISGNTRMAFPNAEFSGWDEPLDDLVALTPGTNPRLAKILTKAMSFKPTDRYATAGQLFAELKGIR